MPGPTSSCIRLTDLPRVLGDEAELAAAYPRNARIRTEGTHNLVAAAKAAAARRFIVQSVAFAYAPGKQPYREIDPLNVADGPRVVTVRAAANMEEQVLNPEWSRSCCATVCFTAPVPGARGPRVSRRVHVDAAAQAALLGYLPGEPGIFNIADDDGTVSIEKARREMGFRSGVQAGELNGLLR